MVCMSAGSRTSPQYETHIRLSAVITVTNLSPCYALGMAESRQLSMRHRSGSYDSGKCMRPGEGKREGLQLLP